MTRLSVSGAFRRLVFVGFGVLFLTRGAHASCGAESCSLENGAFGSGYRRFSFEASYQTVEQDRARIGTRSASLGEIPSHADELLTRSRTVLMTGQVSVSRRLVAAVNVPYVSRVHIHRSHDHAVGEEPPLREWHFDGIGDATLMGSFRAWGRGDETTPVTVSIQAGLKAPTGSRHVAAIDGEEPEPHGRLGTGSYDAMIGAHLMHFRSVPTLGGSPAMLPIFGTVTYVRTGRGTDDYRVGRMWEASLGTAYPLGDRVQLLGQVNLRAHARDDARVGEVGEEPGPVLNTGGQAVYVSPGLRVRAGSFLSLSAYMQIPVYQNVNEIQLVAPYHTWLGATYRVP